MRKNTQNTTQFSRRDFLAAMTVPLLVSKTTFAAGVAKGKVKISSPNGQVQFQLNPETRMNYQILFKNKPVIEQSRTVKIPLAFLGAGKFETLLIRDVLEKADDVKVETSWFSKKDLLTVEMRAGGGFIARFG